MILITSAKYVNPELQAEFGKIPPSFLPLGGKRLYTYQISLFEDLNDNIVLSLPKSYVLPKQDKKILREKGVQIVFVPDKLKLGESIVYVLNMLLPIKGGLHILHGDTLYQKINTSHIFKNEKVNLLMVSKVDINYDWTYLFENHKNIFNAKVPTSNNDDPSDLVLSGYFYFSNPYQLISSIVQSSYNFIDALKEYGKKFGFDVLINDTWMDFGLVTSYFQSKKSFTTERIFNELKISDDYVTKCSQNSKKLEAEIQWFQNFPNEINLYIPKFSIGKNGCYKTEYLYLNTLNELYVFGNLPVFEWRKIFFSIKFFIDKLHSYKSDQLICNYDYKTKTLQRLIEFSKQNNIDLNKKWTYNGVRVPSLKTIVDDLEQYIDKNDEYVFIHGDLCFSNIMYDFRANRIKVFDPRGMDFDGKITCYGKAEYDYAKLMHSIFGLYDHIIAGFYTCNIDEYDISFSIEVSNQITEIQQVYLEIFDKNKFESLYAIMIHLFLSMLPLHNDNAQKQNALLANALRLYLQLKKGDFR